jgi:hypothetical protein
MNPAFRFVKASEIDVEKIVFSEWLILQAARRDPIGHLAADFKRDIEDDPELKLLIDSPSRLRARMEHLGACGDALKALDEAQKEYSLAQ